MRLCFFFFFFFYLARMEGAFTLVLVRPHEYNLNPPSASSPVDQCHTSTRTSSSSIPSTLCISAPGLQNRSQDQPFFTSCSKNCIPFSFCPRCFWVIICIFDLIFHIALQERAILFCVIPIASSFPPHPLTPSSLRNFCRWDESLTLLRHFFTCCAPVGAAPLHHRSTPTLYDHLQLRCLDQTTPCHIPQSLHPRPP